MTCKYVENPALVVHASRDTTGLASPPFQLVGSAHPRRQETRRASPTAQLQGGESAPPADILSRCSQPLVARCARDATIVALASLRRLETRIKWGISVDVSQPAPETK